MHFLIQRSNRFTVKPIVIIIVAFIIIAILIGAFLLFITPKEAGQPQNNNQIQENKIPQPSLLTVINNSVNIKTALQTDFKEVTEKTAQVKEGDTVKTSASGRAIIESQNNATLVIDKNSEYIMTVSAENKSSMMLVLGNIWAQVTQLLGQGEYYKIETANAVATVRGTSFGVSYGNNLTIVMVAVGKVSLQSVNPANRQPIGKEIVISAGEKGSVATGYEPLLQALSGADKRSGWYLLNQGNVKNPPAPSQLPTVPAESKR